VGAAWEEGEESDVLSAGSERAGAGVVDPPGSAVADAASCEDPSEERAGAPVDVVVEAGSGEVSAGEPSAVAGPWVEKYSAQLGSTLEGASRHCSRSASTRHCLGPNSAESESCVCCDTLRSPAFSRSGDTECPQPSGRRCSPCAVPGARPAQTLWSA